ncbi:MAG: hypothetical protein E6R03_06785 [Hyphomicrobiaceae bacterium]|nr:MAG: hypothetical protein E6R03_06785 [Hyphomicrobiaceae bacterium]
MPRFVFRKSYRYTEEVMVEAESREAADKLVDSADGDGEQFDAYLDAVFVRELPDEPNEDQESGEALDEVLKQRHTSRRKGKRA